MKNLSLFLLFFLLFSRANAQQQGEAILSGKVAKQGIRYAKSITTEDLKHHLYVLASDSLEGRETGTKGLQKAAAYIGSHFQLIGLSAIDHPQGKSYYQPFELNKLTREEGYIIANGKKYLDLHDFIFLADTSKETQKEVVFVGRGNESDYQGKNVQSKAVLMLHDSKQPPMSSVLLAQSKGADVVLVLDLDTAYSIKNRVALNKKEYNKPDYSLPISSDTSKSLNSLKGGFISEEVAASILGVNPSEFSKVLSKDSSATLTKLQAATPSPIILKYIKTAEPIQAENVLGYIEGEDKKEEVIVITAHYDHEGIGTPIKADSIYNGADDNASGTVALMELAEAFAMAKQKGKSPRRSLLFLAVSAEEKGLLGSSYYVDNPVFPIQNTVTNINIDMIGRLDSAHINDTHYVYVVGPDRLSSELHRVNEAVNAKYINLKFDYKYNAKDDPEHIYERSDHYNFAKKDIPIVFFFSGLHPDYHKVTDSADKINYNALQKRTQMIFHLAWELANRVDRVELDTVSEKKEAVR